MNVLHVVPSVAPDRGGPSRSVLRLIEALALRGVNVRLAARGAEDVPLEHLAVPGEIPNAASRRALSHAIRQADVVEIHSLWNGTVSIAATLCRRAGIPYILTPRGMLDPACLRIGALRKRAYTAAIDRRTVSHAAGFHFLSEDERDRAVIPTGIPAALRIVAPNGVSAPPPLRPDMLRTLLPQVGERPVMLHLGRIDTIKGIDLQLHALSLIEPAVRPVLVLVGPDFGAVGALRVLAARLGVADSVVWGEPQYGVERLELLAGADVVVLTSIYDCNPVAVTEALSVGAAVVATEGCGVGGVARAGAALVVPREPQAFAQAVQQVLTDAALRDALRARARAYATELSWGAVIDPLLALYDRVAAPAVLSAP